MQKYCRAYQLKDLRLFSNWDVCCSKETLLLSGEAVCFLCDDLTVIQSPFVDDCVFFSAVNTVFLDAWKVFCLTNLQFVLPEALVVNEVLQVAASVPNTQLTWTVDPLGGSLSL